MRIKKHDKSYIVELEDRSKWRIWPGDIAVTLQWLPTADIVTTEIEDEFCTHALINRTDDSRVRAIEASKDWPVCRGLTVVEGRIVLRSSCQHYGPWVAALVQDFGDCTDFLAILDPVSPSSLACSASSFICA